VNGLERRLQRLEQRTQIKHGCRLIYISPNLQPDELQKSAYLIKLSSDLWAHVFGAPLSDEEIRKLREEYSEEEHLK